MEENAKCVDDLPSECIHECIRHLPLPDLSTLRRVSGRFDSVVEYTLHNRLRKVLLPFGIADVPRFLLLLLATDAAMAGEVPTWLYHASPTWTPTELTVFVGDGRLRRWLRFVPSMGWRVSHSVKKLTLGLPMRTTTRFVRHRNDTLSITLIECKGWTTVKPILSSVSTMFMNMMTATSYISFYPKLLERGECMVRHIDGTKMWQYVAKGLEAKQGVIIDNINAESPCSECPRLRRRVAGGRGISGILWNMDLVRRLRTKRWDDEYMEAVLNKFPAGVYDFSWQFSSHCMNLHCPYLSLMEKQPKFVDYLVTFHRESRHAMQLTSTDIQYNGAPIISKVQRLTDFEVNAREQYIADNNLRVGCRGIVFGIGCSKMQLVSVPLDHGIAEYRTVEDLTPLLWMDCMEFLTSRGIYSSKLKLESKMFHHVQKEKSFTLMIFGPPNGWFTTAKPLPRWRASTVRTFDRNYSWSGSLLVVKLNSSKVAMDLTEQEGPMVETFVREWTKEWMDRETNRVMETYNV